MTVQEAIKYHRMNHQSFVEAMWDGTDNNPMDEAFLMAFKALEKQVPKKPVLTEDKMWTCSCCGNNLMWKWLKYPEVLMPKEMAENYCMACGQANDWGVLDE